MSIQIPSLENPYYIASNIKIGQCIKIYAQTETTEDSTFKDYPRIILHNDNNSTYIMPDTISVQDAANNPPYYNFCTIQGSSICFGTTTENDQGPQDTTHRTERWNLYLNNDYALSIATYSYDNNNNKSSQNILKLSNSNIQISKPLTGIALTITKDDDHIPEGSLNLIKINTSLGFNGANLYGVNNITASKTKDAGYSKVIRGFSSIQADSFKTSDNNIILNHSVYKIWTSGSIAASSFYATSDVRLKTNIKSYTPKASILDLPIYEFDYKSNGQHTIGCLAQDLQKICPEIVSEDKDGFLHIEESKLVYLLLEEVKKLRQMYYDKF